MLRLTRLFIPIASLCVAPAAWAETSPDPIRLSAEFSVGGITDSDVGIADLDQTTRNSDTALKLGAKLNVEAKPTNKLTLRAGYEFNDTQYQEFSDFDLQTHLATGEAAYTIGKTDAGLMVAFADARLDGASYLVLSQASPFVQRTFGSSLVLRGAYVRAERDFKIEDGRDATSDELQADAFFLLDSTNRYVILGGKTGTSKADDSTFSFTSGGGKARFVNRFDLFGQEAKLRLGAEAEIRDFESIPAGMTETRRDELLAGTGDLSVPIRGPISLDLGYEYRARESNLQAADYDEHVGRAELKVAF